MKKNIFLLFIFLAFSFAGCKKYKDGPFISLRTKIDRISNIWMLDKYIVNGEDSTLQYADFTYRFSKDKSYDFFGTVNGVAWARSGDWEFIDSKKSIRLENLGSTSTYEYHITKLRNKELWFEQQDSITGVSRFWQLKQKKN